MYKAKTNLYTIGGNVFSTKINKKAGLRTGMCYLLVDDVNKRKDYAVSSYSIVNVTPVET